MTVRYRARDLLEVRPATMPWTNNLRLVAPVFTALVGFTAAGNSLDGILVALGAYIALFGAGQPGRRRLKTFGMMSALMLAPIGCGAAVADSAAMTTVGYAGLALIPLPASVVVDLGPPGPYFLALMVGRGALPGASG